MRSREASCDLPSLQVQYRRGLQRQAQVRQHAGHHGFQACKLGAVCEAATNCTLGCSDTRSPSAEKGPASAYCLDPFSSAALLRLLWETLNPRAYETLTDVIFLSCLVSERLQAAHVPLLRLQTFRASGQDQASQLTRRTQHGACSQSLSSSRQGRVMRGALITQAIAAMPYNNNLLAAFLTVSPTLNCRCQHGNCNPCMTGCSCAVQLYHLRLTPWGSRLSVLDKQWTTFIPLPKWQPIVQHCTEVLAQACITRCASFVHQAARRLPDMALGRA